MRLEDRRPAFAGLANLTEQHDHDMQVVEDLCAGLRQLGIQPETLSYPFVVTRYNGLECGM